MNERPVSYLQTDPKWRYEDYSAPGEKTTIGASGCGPTAMAMVLATWASPKVTPKTECDWALKHGYKAPHSGTYYGYFEPAGKRYGLKVRRLNSVNIYGNNGAAYHTQAKEALEQGHLVIACMGKGTWTSSGHYVLVYGIQGNTIYINDPASTKAHRVRGDYSVFRKQVKYYWVIERPEWMKEDEDVDINKMLEEMTDEQAYTLLKKAQRYAGKLEEPDWSKTEGIWKEYTEAGITDGDRPEGLVTRCEVVALIGRAERN